MDAQGGGDSADMAPGRGILKLALIGWWELIVKFSEDL